MSSQKKCVFCQGLDHSIRDMRGNIICKKLLDNTCTRCDKRGHTPKNCNEPKCDECSVIGHTTRQHRLQVTSKTTISKSPTLTSNAFNLLDKPTVHVPKNNSIVNKDNEMLNDFPSLGNHSTSISTTNMNFANAAAKPIVTRKIQFDTNAYSF